MRSERKRARMAVADMRAAMTRARQFLDELNIEEFSRDDMRRSAVERQVEIVSEASRRLGDWRDAEPDVPWRQVADIGNILRHAYDIVAADIIWTVVRRDFEPLEAALVRIERCLDAEGGRS